MTGKQVQRSGDQSVNIQSQGDVNVGITYTEARQIAQDVFEANFYRLSETAYDVARQRADELVSAYLRKLAERNPEALKSTQDPDMQYALFTAQKEFARTGDNDLADILVDILVDRASHSERSLLQLVLNESLLVAPKLTSYQYDTLSVIFIVRYTRRIGMNGIEMLAQYLRTTILPFIDDLRSDNSCYQHLEYAGCGAVQIGARTFEDALKTTYPGLFWKGATKQDLDELPAIDDIPPQLIIPSLHNPELFQFSAIDENTVTKICREHNYPEERIGQLVSFQKKHLMDDQQIKEFLVNLEPRIKRLIDVWDSSSMQNFTLTSVGIAIAHANIRRKINDELDLTIWIK